LSKNCEPEQFHHAGGVAIQAKPADRSGKVPSAGRVPINAKPADRNGKLPYAGRVAIKATPADRNGKLPYAGRVAIQAKAADRSGKLPYRMQDRLSGSHHFIRNSLHKHTERIMFHFHFVREWLHIPINVGVRAHSQSLKVPRTGGLELCPSLDQRGPKKQWNAS
jgi:hypothetical protein